MIFVWCFQWGGLPWRVPGAERRASVQTHFQRSAHCIYRGAGQNSHHFSASVSSSVTLSDALTCSHNYSPKKLFLNEGKQNIEDIQSVDKFFVTRRRICYDGIFKSEFFIFQVFEAVISWINHDITNRESYLAQLMEHVRLPLMSQEYLVQRVEEEPLIKTNTQCKDYLIEAMKYHLLKGEQKTMYRTPRTNPRTPIGLPKVRSSVSDKKLPLYYSIAGRTTSFCHRGDNPGLIL